MSTREGMLRRLKEATKTDRMALERSSLFLSTISIEVAQNIVSVDSRCSTMLDFPFSCTIYKLFKKILEMKIDFVMKFFLVVLKREVRGVAPNCKHPSVFQLVPFRPMSASDIHASVKEG
jgi:hypothetical protein